MHTHVRIHIILILGIGLSGCATAQLPPATVTADAPTGTVTVATPAPTATLDPTATPAPVVPDFEHIALIVFENKEFGTVIGNGRMPYFNQLARSHTLLTQYYAVTHPSLPNYLALISGDTFGLDFNCTKCLYDARTLPDLIEAGGRTWKTYQEDMPRACYEGADYGLYAMKHNPFMYFEAIRLDKPRCERSVVPLGQLYADIAADELPSYLFIKPNLCNDSHDCELDVADEWLESLMLNLQPALASHGNDYLVVVTWEEGQGNHSCCGLPAKAGGRVATVLVSPRATAGFEDATPYTHYSLLKTISAAWGLPYIGHAEDPSNVLIVAPWN